MKILITDQKEAFGAWVAEKVEMRAPWGGFYAMGVVDTEKKAIVAGVVINQFNGSNALAHIAIERGAGRQIIKMLESVADYAFNQCNLKRLTGMVPASKPDVLAFDLNLGWQHEFTMKCGAPDGEDMHVLVMWPEKCKWLKPRQEAKTKEQEDESQQNP
ncbi:MAG: hypothetical protein ABFC67_14590 [Mizugakiibacter sp.]|uniref:hypothetical protein n=1 Tax=Mizugakiibacter sp. TaxID=1972610 RepID=UPI0032116EF4